MAVVTTKSTVITNRDATPAVPNNSRLSRARVHASRGVAALASGDSIGSKYIFFSIPSNAIVRDLLVSAPDIGTTTAGDIGLYQTTANGGAVVDADFFTAAFVLNAGAVSRSNAANGNVLSPANGEKTLWEALGLTADPSREYDVVLTLTGAADAAGSVLIDASYVS